jgi:kynureninase
MPITRADALALDQADPLAGFRDRFVLPPDVIYLDGNSLGALPKDTAARVRRVVEAEWGQDLIVSWNEHGWYPMPSRVGDKIARLIGAAPGEVVCADSTSVNLFKLLAAALRMRPDRPVIVSERGNFPTDLYVAQGLVDMVGGGRGLRMVDDPARVIDAIDARTAVVSLTHVNYKSGRVHDMAAITKRAHDHGALMLWDLAHSAGALPVDLNGAGADFAVGCGYKYLNGGPGAPAFLFVAKRHQETARSPLSGWMGHADPFAFVPGYRPAAGILRQLCGTPPVVSMAALEASLDVMLEADMGAIRKKSLALGDLFLTLAKERLGGFGFGDPTPPRAERGSQVGLTHAEGYAIMQALIARGVIGDFRAPDLLRFGLTPLYVRYVDVFDAVEALRDIMATRAWDTAAFKRRAAVT